MNTRTIHLGSNREKPRVYLQGKWLNDVGFATGTRFTATIETKKLTLKATAKGDRKVTGKADGSIPIIDLNSEGLSTLGKIDAPLTLTVVRKGCITVVPAKGR